MADSSETLGQMKTRHKLEIRQLEKDFRAKVKITKGKDKKRAVKAEQAAAEKEMKERHAKERSAKQPESEESETKAPEITPKVDEKKPGGDEKKEVRQLSRAQKKKLKKQAKLEEERKKAQAEAAKMTDYKAIEMNRLMEKLKPKGFKVHEVQADGNCLFRACVHQLDLDEVKNKVCIHANSLGRGTDVIVS
ncbi:hypothetical protein AAMO2058_000810200 [Amorphochlora amoebiformis]